MLLLPRYNNCRHIFFETETLGFSHQFFKMTRCVRRMKPTIPHKMTINAISRYKCLNPVERFLALGPDRAGALCAKSFCQLLKGWFDTAANLTTVACTASPTRRLRLKHLCNFALTSGDNSRVHAGVTRSNDDNISL